MGLLLFTLIGSFAARGRPWNGVYYNDVGDFVEALIIGAITALVFLAVIGSVGYGISRARGSDKNWGNVAFSRAAMITTLVLLVVSAAGRAAQHQEAVEKARPNATGSPTEREKANLEAQKWTRSRTPLLNALKAALLQNPRFIKTFSTQGNTPAVRRLAARLEQQFEDVQTRWQVLPTSPLADLQEVDAQLVEATGLATRSYADYVAGLKANLASGVAMSQDKGALALLDSGDRKLNRAVALLQQLGKRLLALDAKYGIP